MNLTISDLDLEKKLLHYFLVNERHANNIVEKVDDPAIFNDEKCRDMFMHIKKYFQRYNTLPTSEVLEDIFKDAWKDNEERYQDMKMFLKHLYSLTPVDEDFQYTIDKVIHLYMARGILQTLDDGIDTKQDLVTSQEEIEKIVMVANKVMKTENFRKVELNANVAERMESYDKRKNLANGIKSGIDALDAITGGWRPGELIVLLASPGEGKSALLLNFAENASRKSRVNVGFASLEMSYEEVLERYHSMVTRIDYSKIRNRLLNDDEKRVFMRRLCTRVIEKESWPDFKQWFKKQDVNKMEFDKVREMMQGQFKMRPEKFYMFDIPRGCTTKLLEMEIKTILKKDPCPIFIIDHLNVMEPTNSTKEMWLDLGMMARQLKGIARDYKITILTAAQLGVVKPNEKITTDNVKYAKKVSEEADYVIGFKVTEEDKMFGRIRLELTKHRHTQESVISIKQMFHQMKITNYEETADSE